jgi:hypothetical protein
MKRGALIVLLLLVLACVIFAPRASGTAQVVGGDGLKRGRHGPR